MVMRILDKMNIGVQVASGADFAAIASAVLIEVE